MISELATAMAAARPEPETSPAAMTGLLSFHFFSPKNLGNNNLLNTILRKGMTPRVVILTLILTPIISFLTLYPWELSSRPYTFSGQFISYFWIIMFFELLGRINPRLRLTKQEMIVFMVVFWLTAGISFIEKRTPTKA